MTRLTIHVASSSTNPRRRTHGPTTQVDHTDQKVTLLNPCEFNNVMVVYTYAYKRINKHKTKETPPTHPHTQTNKQKQKTNKQTHTHLKANLLCIDEYLWIPSSQPECTSEMSTPSKCLHELFVHQPTRSGCANEMLTQNMFRAGSFLHLISQSEIISMID